MPLPGDPTFKAGWNPKDTLIMVSPGCYRSVSQTASRTRTPYHCRIDIYQWRTLARTTPIRHRDSPGVRRWSSVMEPRIHQELEFLIERLSSLAKTHQP